MAKDPNEILDLRGRSDKLYRFLMYGIIVPGFVLLLTYPLLSSLIEMFRHRR